MSKIERKKKHESGRLYLIHEQINFSQRLSILRRSITPTTSALEASRDHASSRPSEAWLRPTPPNTFS